VFLDRQSIASNLEVMKGFPEPKEMMEKPETISWTIGSGQVGVYHLLVASSRLLIACNPKLRYLYHLGYMFL